ncbi:MAG: coproporphyrinogen-III oxidase family protein [Verrucomicrobiota bacterium]|jgi:oxygen-independent coproporphyrinogen-3 oxidase
MPAISAARVAGLYLHVPFCARKCAYCAFYSEPSSGELVNRYVAALIRELEMVADDLKPPVLSILRSKPAAENGRGATAEAGRTIFFGGGTPSLLNLRQWEQILLAMERLHLLGAQEFTVECNPATVSPDKARLLRSFGVNRISMGVQSLDEKLLDRLGRIHTRAMVFKSFDILRRAGFDNLNLDLMFAIPGQTMEIWRATLAEALALGSEHLSSYEVIYEDDTPLFAQLQAGEFDVNEDLACAMHEELVERAGAAGFRQYEVANFARQAKSNESTVRSPQSHCHRTRTGDCGLMTVDIPAFACRHNANYWRGGFFYGLGPSATSYVRGVRTKNWSNTQLYCEQLEKGNRAIESREELPPLKRAGETAAFGLRMVAGWPFEEFERATSFDLRREWRAEMSQLTERGWAEILPDRFRLTRQGLRFADAAAEFFLR